LEDEAPRAGGPPDAELREFWRAAGGRFYSRHDEQIEHGFVMEQERLLPLLRGLVRADAIDALRDLAEVCEGAIDDGRLFFLLDVMALERAHAVLAAHG